jgi:hypothetical protein
VEAPEQSADFVESPIGHNLGPRSVGHLSWDVGEDFAPTLVDA